MNKKYSIVINNICYDDLRLKRLSDNGSDIMMYQRHRYSYKMGLRVLTPIRKKGLNVLFRLLICKNHEQEEKKYKWFIKNYEKNY